MDDGDLDVDDFDDQYVYNGFVNYVDVDDKDVVMEDINDEDLDDEDYTYDIASLLNFNFCCIFFMELYNTVAFNNLLFIELCQHEYRINYKHEKNPDILAAKFHILMSSVRSEENNCSRVHYPMEYFIHYSVMYHISDM